ncbi:MAG: penicillin-binding protein 1C, partial [Ignavibacteria bacterium]
MLHGAMVMERSGVKRRRWQFIVGGAGVASALVVVSFFLPLDHQLFSPTRTTSLRIVDRHGVLLREVLSEQEGRGRWSALEEISPHMVDAMIAGEDARSFLHPGVDLLAVLRAAWQNMKAHRIVSGGSTITMQVVRSVYPIPRTLFGKLREIWYALRLERMLAKRHILEQYLNRVTFGYQAVGVDAAATMYFGKPPSQLSIPESAFLAAIPNAPAHNDPYRRMERVRLRQRYILARMEQEGFITPDERRRAEDDPLVLTPRTASFKAPHFTTMILQQLSADERSQLREIRTTIDQNIHQNIQKSAELLVQAHLQRLRNHHVGNAALVVIDNTKHELLALVGSRDFFDTTAHTQVNGALALRQPGSAIKPFTYGVALINGMTASTLLADIPRSPNEHEVDFLPENYDRRYHGPVRLRVALACSYNVPAVRLVEQFGEELLLSTLHTAGIVSLNKPSAFYGVGLTLGNGEVTLLELSNAYSALACGGMYAPLEMVLDVHFVKRAAETPAVGKTQAWRFGGEVQRVFSPQVAFILTDILSDAQARAPAFGANSSLTLPFPCAAKTGTSKDYRDNWAIGYTPRYTVGVWVGNFDATPMKLVSGITGAAPLMRDMLLALHRTEHAPAAFERHPRLVEVKICPRSGMKPGRHCPGEVHELFLAGTEPRTVCEVHRAFRIDVQSGLLASHSTPRGRIPERVYECFPP